MKKNEKERKKGEGALERTSNKFFVQRKSPLAASHQYSTNLRSTEIDLTKTMHSKYGTFRHKGVNVKSHQYAKGRDDMQF